MKGIFSVEKRRNQYLTWREDYKEQKDQANLWNTFCLPSSLHRSLFPSIVLYIAIFILVTMTSGIFRTIIALTFIAVGTESFSTEKCVVGRLSKTSFPSVSLFAIASPPETEEKDKRRRKKAGKRSNVLRVESITEYKRKVVDEKESIIVVRFYASFCRSCRASEPLFYKLASDFEHLGVKFVEVPLTKDTKVLHDALEVPSLPWTHIYHPDAGLVEERKVSKKFIDEVRKCLRCYVYGECDLADAPADCHNIYGECAIDEEK